MATWCIRTFLFSFSTEYFFVKKRVKNRFHFGLPVIDHYSSPYKLFFSENDTLSTFRFLYREFTQTDRFTKVGVFCLFRGKSGILLVIHTFLKV